MAMDDEPRDATGQELCCREVLQHISAYLDGELTAADRRRLEAHLARCRRCRRCRGDLVALVRGCHDLLADAPPLADGLRSRVLARLRREASARA